MSAKTTQSEDAPHEPSTQSDTHPAVKDIAIIGGGLAGGLCALAMSQNGYQVALVDASPLAAMADAQFDGRTTALSYANTRLFKRLGIWDACKDFAAPINDILVTDGKAQSRFNNGTLSPFFLRFDASELEPQTPLGWIVENWAIRKALHDRLTSAGNIEIHAPANCTSTLYGKSHSTISLPSGKEIHAKLVIGADGKKSALRAGSGIRVNQWAYNQHGIVVTVQHERPHKRRRPGIFPAKRALRNFTPAIQPFIARMDGKI